MIPLIVNEQAPVPPPAYHRAQARLGPALHIDVLTLVSTFHLLTLCRLAVRLAHHRCPPPLSAGPGGSPRTESSESLLLLALLRTLWRLSYEDMRDWLRSWPALALACGWPLGKNGQPRVPCPSHPSGRRTAPACLPPGPKRNWASAGASNASLAGSFSSFICNGRPSVVGLPSHGRWL